MPTLDRVRGPGSLLGRQEGQEPAPGRLQGAGGGQSRGVANPLEAFRNNPALIIIPIAIMVIAGLSCLSCGIMVSSKMGGNATQANVTAQTIASTIATITTTSTTSSTTTTTSSTTTTDRRVTITTTSTSTTESETTTTADTKKCQTSSDCGGEKVYLRCKIDRVVEVTETATCKFEDGGSYCVATQKMKTKEICTKGETCFNLTCVRKTDVPKTTTTMLTTTTVKFAMPTSSTTTITIPPATTCFGRSGSNSARSQSDCDGLTCGGVSGGVTRTCQYVPGDEDTGHCTCK